MRDAWIFPLLPMVAVVAIIVFVVEYGQLQSQLNKRVQQEFLIRGVGCVCRTGGVL